jgi:uncharacterized membrane protein YgcG
MRTTSIWISLGITALLIAAGALLRHSRNIETARVDDDLGLFTPEQSARITDHHAFLLQDHGIDYRVVTRPASGDINRFAVAYFDDSRIGSESPYGHGLLLVIDPEQDQVRLEVSRSLEGIFPDAFVAYVERNCSGIPCKTAV